MNYGSRFTPAWTLLAKQATKRVSCLMVGLLIICQTVPGQWIPGAVYAFAGEVDLLPNWPLSRLRIAAFRNAKMKVPITNLHPCLDPHFHENQLALKTQRAVQPGRELTENADGRYSVSYSAAKKLVFYSRLGKTQAVALVDSENFPQKTLLYAYPSGQLKTIALSFSPKDIFIFTSNGELTETSASKPSEIQGRVVTRSFEEDEDELQSCPSGVTGLARDVRNRDNRLWQQASYQRKVADIGRQLLEANHIQQSVSFVVYNTQQEIQAFANISTGQVVITHELLKYISSDDELAGVLGHELAHVLLNHRIKSDSGIEFRYRSIQFGDKNAINYDELQNREIAADARGVVLAKRAGFDPWGHYKVLQKILSDSDGAALGRSTHPLGSQRLKILAHQIQVLERPALPALTTTTQVPTSLLLCRNIPASSSATFSEFSHTTPICFGQWNETNARREVLKHAVLADALPQAIANMPATDPDASLHQSILSGKTSVTDRILSYSEFMSPYTELMQDTQQGNAGYAVFFPQLKAYPFYRIGGQLISFTLCNQAQYPRTCYTATAADKRLIWLSLEVSDSTGFVFNPQGELLSFKLDSQTYNAQRQRMSVSKRFAAP